MYPYYGMVYLYKDMVYLSQGCRGSHGTIHQMKLRLDIRQRATVGVDGAFPAPSVTQDCVGHPAIDAGGSPIDRIVRAHGGRNIYRRGHAHPCTYGSML